MSEIVGLVRGMLVVKIDVGVVDWFSCSEDVRVVCSSWIYSFVGD